MPSIVDRLSKANANNNKNYLRTGRYRVLLVDSQEKVGGAQSKIAGMEYTPAQVKVMEVLEAKPDSNPVEDVATMFFCRRAGSGAHFYDNEMLEFYTAFAGYDDVEKFKESKDFADVVTALAGPESEANCAKLQRQAIVTAYTITTKKGTELTKYRLEPFN
jgi:hypothetical protein